MTESIIKGTDQVGHVHASNADTSPINYNSSILVGDESLYGGSDGEVVNGNTGVQVGPLVLGTLNDDNHLALANDFRVAIKWGDASPWDYKNGSVTVGTCAAENTNANNPVGSGGLGGCPLQVLGTHTYSNPSVGTEESYPITAWVCDGSLAADGEASPSTQSKGTRPIALEPLRPTAPRPDSPDFDTGRCEHVTAVAHIFPPGVVVTSSTTTTHVTTTVTSSPSGGVEATSLPFTSGADKPFPAIPAAIVLLGLLMAISTGAWAFARRTNK